MAPSQKINLKDKIDDGEIDLSMCDLQDVPVKEIANTKNIYSLDLSNNHLVTLPKNFATLKFLTKLDLSKNSLKELPANFGDLVKLKHLDLYKNELQHLPLSFSKLKMLKWLDLKDNPLVPVIRETAGLCLDSKQCLTCAKNIVQFYSEFQQKLDAEREMRERHRQKDVQANELALQKQKQEKKNKKKGKKQKTIENNGQGNISMEETAVEERPYTHTNDTTKPHKKKTNLCGAIFDFIKMLLVHILLFLLIVFLLTSLKLELTREFEVKVVKQWHQFVETVPQPYHCYLNDISHYLRIAHTNTGNAIYFVVYYIRYITKNINSDNINYVYEKIVNFYYDLFKVK